MTTKQKPPRRGGSVTLPKGAGKEDIDDALRGSPKKSAPKPEEKH